MMTALLTVAAVYLGSLLLRALLAVSYARTLPDSDATELPAGTLAIVQPILSGDPLLESRLAINLGALAGQRFLWLIDDDDPEAWRVAEKLRREHPDAVLQVEGCPPCPDGINPKLWKLERATALVTEPYFCVLDDDTTLGPESAAALVTAASVHSVATGLPSYESSGTLASDLLGQFVNNNSAFTYLGTSRLLPAFTLNGMGYVLRRERLDHIGHFRPILRELTDDLALATLILKNGGSIHQSKAPVRVRTGVRNLAHYLEYMHRWYVFTLLLMRRQSLAVQGLIFALHGLPPLLFAGLWFLAAIIASWQAAAVMAAVILVRMSVLVLVQSRFFGAGLHRPLLSIASELLQPLHLLHGMLSRTIRWRTRHYRVRDSNDFSAV
ncbi:glycosyltransferase family 2 protein [Luteolibacter marinus]|uniref:glycosyltransferase family 2 protein n=1 Tax=Luteolibacter marinus TaxID=2776705 RepID=UPI0018676BDE|nr:glycosyltransferase [Luteolibacter marinus]